VAATTTRQDADVADADPTVIDQANRVDNLGLGVANTGLNVAFGNIED